jgi:hypothetical protein
MKLTIEARSFLAVVMLASGSQTVQAGTAHQRFLSCKARVLYSEELPFAPIGTWLLRATLEISPPHGNPYLATFQDWMPWQGPPLRRGQVLRVQCDPADPGKFPFISRTTVRTAF